MEMPRVLVAEDEYIIALDLCNTVSEAGFVVEGPHPDLKSAMLAAQKAKPDVAILDVNLDDGEAFPLAEKLAEDGVPIIFHSGHFTKQDMLKHFPDAYACEKPCPPNELIEIMNDALAVH